MTTERVQILTFLNGKGGMRIFFRSPPDLSMLQGSPCRFVLYLDIILSVTVQSFLTTVNEH